MTTETERRVAELRARAEEHRQAAWELDQVADLLEAITGIPAQSEPASDPVAERDISPAEAPPAPVEQDGELGQDEAEGGAPDHAEEDEEPEDEPEAPPARDKRFVAKPVNHGKAVAVHNPYVNSA